jgi:hypothetical protein
MKPNEFRIGNYFHPCSENPVSGAIIPNTGIFFRVGSVNKFGEVEVIEPKHQTVSLITKNISPIPLTEKILDNCNFEKHLTAGNNKAAFYSYRYSISEYIELAWYSAEGRLKLQTKLSGFSIDFDIQYLHQLQNLVFALIGKELKIDL